MRIIPKISEDEILKERKNKEEINEIEEKDLPKAEGLIIKATGGFYYVRCGETTYTTVPSVIGYTLEDARMILNSAGIRIGNVERVEADGQSTEVIDQSLPEGTSVTNGSTISLVIIAEKESNANSVEFKIPLPNVSSEVTMSASLAGETDIT